jgi:8-oxo-dGTP pyrophosphatase MutT (NUDIX family)
MDDIVSGYIKRFPAEAGRLAQLIEQVDGGEKLNDRRNFNGHVTGSGIVLSPDRQKVLLIYHKLFDRWQQPGGHWETDDEPDPLEAAKREVEEETSIQVAVYLPLDADHPLVPLDIDSHAVPARPQKDELVHIHHDFRYVFIAASEELHHQEAEVSAAAWFPLDAPEAQIIARAISKLPPVLANS